MDRSQMFVSDVRKLAEKHGVNFFVVTDGASACHNNGSECVKHARESHVRYELGCDIDPQHDWGREG